MSARVRQIYGEGPLHLLALLASMLVVGAAVAGWFDSFPGPTALKIVEWFVAAIIGHDLVLLPLYSALDRIAFGSRRSTEPSDHVPAASYVRVPALLSGIIGLVFVPEILRRGDATFYAASGFHQRVYLVRYLLTCAALFAISAVVYLIGARRARARHGTGADRRTTDPRPG